MRDGRRVPSTRDYAQQLRAAELRVTRLRVAVLEAANHRHLVCRSCGAIADIDRAAGDAPCLTAPRKEGTKCPTAKVKAQRSPLRPLRSTGRGPTRIGGRISWI
ncbi:hypothetical protein [Rhodococcus sp. NPDC058514]|uniref:hypothetical protein n=1 Tax=unclassified Rhodococcus (in: high G+C Gram-positive bacteria) TaxID=192944 RepID=UPI00364D5B3E